MIDAPLALAFAAGMVAAFNPCGFALLPAYLGWFLGADDAGDPDRRTIASLTRALTVSAVVTAGFVVVFGAVGIVVTQFSLSVQRFAPWLAIVIGLGLVGLGSAVVAGLHPTVPTPRFARSAHGRGLASMALFGVSYAVVSLSCTLPVFLAAVATTFDRSTFVSGVSVFAAYALGMGSVLVALALAMALARRAAVIRARRILPFVHRVAGVVLVLAGAYVSYYAWYDLRLNRGEQAGAGPVDWVSGWSADVSNWVAHTGATRIGLVLLGTAAACVAVAWRLAGRPVRRGVARSGAAPEVRRRGAGYRSLRVVKRRTVATGPS